MNTRHGKDVSGDKTGTMGTFAGVFTPSVLTILEGSSIQRDTHKIE